MQGFAGSSCAHCRETGRDPECPDSDCLACHGGALTLPRRSSPALRCLLARLERLAEDARSKADSGRYRREVVIFASGEARAYADAAEALRGILDPRPARAQVAA